MSMGMLIQDTNDTILHVRHIVRMTPCDSPELVLVHMADGYQGTVSVAELKRIGFWSPSLQV